MKLPKRLQWFISDTATLNPLAASARRVALRVSFTAPPDPRWTRYHAVVTTAHPAAVAFR